MLALGTRLQFLEFMLHFHMQPPPHPPLLPDERLKKDRTTDGSSSMRPLNGGADMNGFTAQLHLAATAHGHPKFPEWKSAGWRFSSRTWVEYSRESLHFLVSFKRRIIFVLFASRTATSRCFASLMGAIAEGGGAFLLLAEPSQLTV